MNPRLFLTLLAMTGGLQAADFIRQIQTVNGISVIYDMPLANDQGSVISKPLTANSAIFQLYATVTGSNNTSSLVKLDEKAVGTFLPQVTVQALSEDPYSPPRTRADKPYGMRITIAGMSTDPSVPDSLKKVQVGRSYKLYDPAAYTATGSSGTYADTFLLRSNGNFTDNAILQRLPVIKPTKAVGEESFTVYLHPDAGTPQSELGKATVQIWPVAEGKIENIVEGKTYNAAPRDGNIIVRDAYPKSVTYAQVYKGKQLTGTIGSPLPNAVVAHNAAVPQQVPLVFTDLDDFLQEDGEYTIEVLTITPFNDGAPEIIDHVTFDLDRVIEVRGTTTTME